MSRLLRIGVQNFDGEPVLPDGSTLLATYRGIARLLPGRHLSLVAPVVAPTPMISVARVIAGAMRG